MHLNKHPDPGQARRRFLPALLVCLLPAFFLTSAADSALAQMRLQSGSYVGDGQPNQPITGLGFSPDLLIIKADDASPAVARTSTMIGDAAKELTDALPLESDLVQSLDGDGFTVGNDSRVNASGVTYTWTAFAGSPGEMTLGTYTGDGFDDRSITGIGFRPDYLVVIPEGATRPTQRFPDQVGFNSTKFGLTAQATNWIQAFQSDGFQVGDHTSTNAAGETFHYVAWSATGGRISGSSYQGNDNDDRNITGAGFQPDYVILKHAGGGEPAVHRPSAVTGDNTLHFRPIATISNGMQQLQADGFQVGSGTEVNEGGNWFYWVAFRDSPSSTDLAVAKSVDDATPFEGQAITYTVTVENLGLDGATGAEVTDLLPGGVTYASDTPSQGSYVSGTGIWTVGSIAAGDTATLNLSATVNPGYADSTITNTASITALDQSDPDGLNDTAGVDILVQDGDFRVVTGSYVGDGQANQVITGIGFQPDFVILKGEHDRHSLAHSSTMIGDVTKELGTNAVLKPNRITSLDADGFTVGSVAAVNDVSVNYHWVAFLAAPGKMAVGTYSGDGTDNRSITGLGFLPAYTIVMSEDAEVPMQRFPAQAGDKSLPFIASDEKNDRIQAFEPDGFQVGKHNTVNESGRIFHYVAWRSISGQVTGNLYVGDANDNRSISGVGFRPEYLILSRGSNGVPTVHRPASLAGDNTLHFINDVSISNAIQSFLPDGFQIGTTDEVNKSGDLFYWVAFEDASSLDLSLIKTVDNAAPDEGDTLSYTVTLTNNGPENATGVEVTDLLPPGLTYLADMPSQGTYTSGTGLWLVGDVDSGASNTLTLVGTVDAGTSGSIITNVALVSGVDQADIDNGNDLASVAVTVRGADLRVSKSVDNPTPSEADTLVYHVLVTNNGPDPATGVEITDLLPWGLTFLSDSTSQGTYTPGSGVWSVGTLTGGASDTLLLSATVNPGTSGSQITNTAAVTSSDQGDPVPGNETDSIAVAVAGADLNLVKTISDPVPNLGDTLIYVITLKNSGPDTATGIQVTDLLPSQVTYLSDSSTQGTYTSGSGLWDVGTVAVADSAVLVLNVEVATGSAGVAVSNLAAVTAVDQTDPVPGNESDNADFVVEGADLALAKSVDNPWPSVGDTVVYSVILTNNGPDDATGVKVIDLLPGAVTYLSHTSTRGNYGLGAGLWNLGTVSGGTADTLLLEVAIDATAAGSTVSNVATVTGVNQQDPSPGNETAQADMTVRGIDLSLVKLVNDLNPNEGDTLTYTVTLTNSGPDSATGIQVTDLLPETLTYLGDSPSQGSYNPGTGLWDVGILADSTGATLILAARVDAGTQGTTVSNIAAVTAVNQGDTAPGDEADTVDVVVQGADLTLEKTVSDPDPQEGDAITYTITVTNNGPDPATGIQVTDLLPSGVTYVSDTPSQGSYAEGTGRWDIGILASGASSSLLIDVTVDPGTGGTSISNLASVTAVDQADPAPGDEEATAGIAVQNRIVVSAAPQLSAVCLPGAGPQKVFELTLTNQSAEDEILTGLTLTNGSSGPGTPSELDADWSVLSLYRSSGPGAGSYLGSASFTGGRAVFSGVSTSISSGQVLTLEIRAGASLSARNGDIIDLYLSGPTDLSFSSSVVLEGNWPLDPLGFCVVDGMSAAQITVNTVPGRNLAAGSIQELVLDVIIPPNGYQTDLLNRFDVVNLGTARPGTDIEWMELWVDEGAAGFNPAADRRLGILEDTGDRWEITGLSEFVPLSGLHLFVSVDISEATTQVNSLRLQIPSTGNLGVGMASGNSGPLDKGVANSDIITISTQDKIIIGANLLPSGTVNPGQKDIPLNEIIVTNTYTGTKTISRMAFSNTSSGSGSSIDLDRETEILLLYADGNDNQTFDRASDILVGTATFLNGKAVFSGLSVDIAQDESRHLFLMGEVSLDDAADGDVLSAHLAGPLDLAFDTPTSVLGSWPASSGARWTIDGMVAKQLSVAAGGVATLGPADGPILAMDFVVPANGYVSDNLNGISIINLGSADDSDFSELRLWMDGGDLIPDGGAGDDTDLGGLTWTGSSWQSLSMSAPLSGIGARLFLTMSVSPSFSDSAATVQFAVPQYGIVVATGNDGPIDRMVQSSHQFLLSTAPLLAGIQIPTPTSTVGQDVTVSMMVENQGAENVNAVLPSALIPNGSGSLTLVSGPTPPSLDLSPGMQGVFTWVFRADGPGEVWFTGDASGTGATSGLPRGALESASNIHGVFLEAADLRITPVESMPFVVGLGQTGVIPFSLTFSHPGGPGSSDIELTRIRLRLEDENGGDIIPADLLTRMVVNEGQNIFLDKTTFEISGGEVDLLLGPPFDRLVITHLEPATVSIRLDVSASTSAQKFRVVLTDSTVLEARDVNSGAPVAFLLDQGTFPVRSRLASLVTEATQVQVSSGSSSTLRAGPGQQSVPLLDFTMESIGITGVTSAARVAKFAVGLTDTSGVPVPDPWRYLKRLEVLAGGQTVFNGLVDTGSGDSLSLTLSPFSLEVNTPETINIVADLSDTARAGHFRLVLKDPATFTIADANTGSPVSAVYVSSPVAGHSILVETPAQILSAGATPGFSSSMAIGSLNVTGISATLEHPGLPGTARIRVGGLKIGCRNDRGELLVPDAYLSTVRLRWEGTDVAIVTDLPPSAELIDVPLPGYLLEPGQRVSVDVIVDIDTGAPSSLLQLTVHGTDFSAFDANVGDPVALSPLAGQSFPLVSGLTQLEPPPRELRAGLDSSIPAVLAGDGQPVVAGTLTLTNPAAPGSGDINLRYLALDAADRDFQQVAMGAAASQISLFLDGVLLGSSAPLTPDSISARITFPSTLVLPPTQSVEVEIQFSVRPDADLESFRIGCISSGIGVEQPSGALLNIDVRPRAGQSFPLWTEAAGFASLNLERSFSNFPNPFAAGRENTTFAFYLPMNGRVTLDIWTPRGERVLTLIDDQNRPAGMHQIDLWNGRNGKNTAVRNGVYIAELKIAFADGSSRKVLRKIAVRR